MEEASPVSPRSSQLAVALTLLATLVAIAPGRAQEGDESEDIVEIVPHERPDYAALEAGALAQVSVLYFERCGVDGDEGDQERAARDWTMLRTMGYSADQLQDIATRFPDDCGFVSLRSAVVAVEKPPRVETRSGGRPREPLRDQRMVVQAQATGQTALTGLFGAAHVLVALRLATLDREGSIDDAHRNWAWSTREAHQVGAVFTGVRLVPLVAAAHLSHRTLQGHPQDLGAPFVILGGVDLVIGGWCLFGAIRSTQDRPILDAWDTLQPLSTFSSMVLWSGAIIHCALGGIELVAGLIGAPRTRFQREGPPAARSSSVRLHPVPGGLLVEGRF